MIVELHRLKIPLRTIRHLAEVMEDSSRIESESLDITADFSEVRDVFGRFYSANPQASSVIRAKLDRELAMPLHRSLLGLSRRKATDMQFWQWLCVCEFKDIVWYRWYGRIPTTFSGIITPPLAERFLGAPTLHGVSRNTFARLWWCAEPLYSEEDGYDLVHIALSRQDFFNQMFERLFCLYIPAARAFVRVFRDSSQDEIREAAKEDEIREAAKELDHYFTTIVAEALNEEDIIHNLLSKYLL